MRAPALGILLIAGSSTLVLAREPGGRFRRAQTSGLSGRPVGGGRPAPAAPAYLTGARIMADGEGALVIDADSGALLKTDAAGKSLGELAIARDAGLLTFDAAAHRAYVADRHHDRIAVVDTDQMTVLRTIRTPAEPYGIALTPDRGLVLVSTIADRTLAAYDVNTGAEAWRAPLAAEPRGLAIAPDGSRAMVAYLATGTVEQLDLRTRRTERIALAAGASQRCTRCGNTGDSFARAAFAVTYLGNHQAVVPFQREVPVQDAMGEEQVGSYGGGSESPVIHQLAFLGFGDGATAQATMAIGTHQPHAMVWDGQRDTLFVAGLGNEQVLQVKNASQATVAEGLRFVVRNAERDNSACGPDGLAVTPRGTLLVWCAFSRSVATVTFDGDDPLLAADVKHGPELIASAFTAKAHEGYELFHVASSQVSRGGAMACASCHPDNRADGLSWRIEKHELQTPLLAGRLVGTHPFKWDGGDPSLRASLHSTMKRLGGTGLSRKQTDALAAYLESLPTVRTPTRDATQVARGRQLFEAEGCRACHDGPSYTDRDRHKLAGTLKESDTPSLLGVWASAPYFHDGSAATLEALLRDRGAVHGMADTAKLSDQQVSDLTAFLDTL